MWFAVHIHKCREDFLWAACSSEIKRCGSGGEGGEIWWGAVDIRRWWVFFYFYFFDMSVHRMVLVFGRCYAGNDDL